MNIYILNPDTGIPVAIDDWKKDGNPTRAEAVVIMRTFEPAIVLAKSKSARDVAFSEAQELAAKTKVAGLEGKAFRCPTRKECIDIYDAKKDGLDEVLEAIGGDPVTDWYWTCEKWWFARRNYAYSAWFFYGNSGTLHTTIVGNAFRCQAVTLVDFN